MPDRPSTMSDPRPTAERSIRAVAVYCASSEAIDAVHFDAAADLGRLLAQRGIMLVYGGGRLGLMGRIADAVHEQHGRVHGVITEKLRTLELARDTCDTLEIVRTMRQRKQRMEELADAFIALPGGIGTYEEFFEILVGRVLADHLKPIVVVNVDGHFDPLLDLLRHGVEHRFIKPTVLDLVAVAESPGVAIDMLAERRRTAAHPG